MTHHNESRERTLWNVRLWLLNDPDWYAFITSVRRLGWSRSATIDHIWRHLPASTPDGYPYRRYAVDAAVREACNLIEGREV